MRQLFSLIIASMLLSGCSYLHAYRPTIQQGNVINMKKVAQLHNGMSQRSVVRLIGNPTFTNTFDDNRLVYVYTVSPNNKPTVNKRLFLTFRGDRLSKIEKRWK